MELARQRRLGMGGKWGRAWARKSTKAKAHRRTLRRSMYWRVGWDVVRKL